MQSFKPPGSDTSSGTVWSNGTAEMLNKLQVVQNRAAWMVLCCDYYTSIILMHKNENWLFVEDKLLYYLHLSGICLSLKLLRFSTFLLKHTGLCH